MQKLSRSLAFGGVAVLGACSAVNDFDFRPETAALPETVQQACESSKLDEGVFVSAAVTPTGSEECGAMTAPCGSIAEGMERALKTQRQTLFLAAGIYREQVTLRAGLTLRGGFEPADGAWTPDCSKDAADTTVIASPENMGVKAEYEGSSTLHTLTIRTASSADPGESHYAIFARGAGTTLQLHNVVAVASEGGPGTAGAAGAAPPASAQACEPYLGTDAGDDGKDGQAGRAATEGSFDQEGYHTADGRDGEDGAAGKPGLQATKNCRSCLLLGAAATCQLCVETVCKVAPPLFPETVLDRPSQGSIPLWGVEPTLNPDLSVTTTTTSCKGGEAEERCTEPGRSGCGGSGGGGGGGGQGGGASVALLVADANVSITGGSLSASRGGAGGEGGEGSEGALAEPGTVGGETPCYTCQEKAECRLGSSPVKGAPGNAGGHGGRGGDGGRGAAGVSRAIQKVGSAVVRVEESTELNEHSDGD